MKVFMTHHAVTDLKIAPHISPLVLVVEDDPLIALSIEEHLIEAGLRVLGPAGSVKDALEFLATLRPDVAVLDFNLRGEVVTNVAGRLRELGVPFVMSSASPPSSMTDLVFLDIENLGKPIRFENLDRALRAIADRNRLN